MSSLSVAIARLLGEDGAKHIGRADPWPPVGPATHSNYTHVQPRTDGCLTERVITMPESAITSHEESTAAPEED